MKRSFSDGPLRQGDTLSTQVQLNPDAVITVRFKTTEEGGRSRGLDANFYGCPLFIDGQGFDCRFLHSEPIDLGTTYEVPIKFLDSSTALSVVRQGASITLWEGKDVASGTVLAVCSQQQTSS
jgi:hypothetical protein